MTGASAALRSVPSGDVSERVHLASVSPAGPETVLGELAVPAVHVSPDVSVLEMDEWFRTNPSCSCVVVSGPAGPSIVDRAWFQHWITGRLGYGRAVHSRARLRDLAVPEAVMLPADTSVSAAAAALAGDSGAVLVDVVGVVGADGRIATASVAGIFRSLSEGFAFLATHDPLTGLPNRAYLRQHLQQAATARSGLTVMYVDLDRFKDVNDGLGHGVGDQVLVLFADRLRRIVGAQDRVVRLGGDEFAVLLAGAISPAHAHAVGERIVSQAGKPFVVATDRDGRRGDDVVVSIGASVGVADLGGSLPADGASLDLLLEQADLAMYAAKKQGRGCVVFFDPLLSGTGEGPSRRRARHHLERRLRAAISKDRLRLHYQPLADLRTGAIVGAEALSRWQDSELGTVSAEEFIAVAEESGLIVDLGRWALRTACQDAASWPGPDQGTGTRALPSRLRVSVNVSPVQLSQPSFVEDVISALRDSGLPPHRLCLEITETVAIGEVTQTAGLLQQMRDIGVAIALDDFGTGYSSLTMLRDLPVSTVKIDKSFVDRVVEDSADAVLARLVIETAHCLGKSVCAEGVETYRQANRLRDMGCDVAQGRLIASPLPGSAAFVHWLSHRTTGAGRRDHRDS